MCHAAFLAAACRVGYRRLDRLPMDACPRKQWTGSRTAWTAGLGTLCAWMAFGAAAPADVLYPDRDTRLSSVTPGQTNNNYGASTTFALNEDSRELMYFDFTQVAGFVTSATLRLYVDGGFVASDRIITAFEIASANSNWSEGTSSGFASPGEPTWGHRQFTNEFWAGSAGLSTAGTDYDPAALGAVTATTGTAIWEMPLDVPRVNGWAQNPADHAGILLVFSGGSGSVIFGSRENGDPALRPNIEYHAVPEPMTMALVSVPLAAFWIRWRRRRTPPRDRTKPRRRLSWWLRLEAAAPVSNRHRGRGRLPPPDLVPMPRRRL